MSERDDLASLPSGATMPKEDVWDWPEPALAVQFAWIAVGELNVDREYQREKVSNARVLEIAKNWKWKACGVLIVVRRVDGSLWVTDGQHRWLAARKRTSISKLPCLVFEADGADKASEADSFLCANTQRGHVDTYSKYRAGLVRGDEDCYAVTKIVRATGYAITSRCKGRNAVGCVASLLREYRYDRETMSRVWPVVAKLAAGEHVGHKVFDALCYVERHLQNSKSGTVAEGKIIDAIQRATYAGIEAAIRKREIQMDVGGPKVWADGVIRYVLNAGRRGGKIPTPYASTD